MHFNISHGIEKAHHWVVDSGLPLDVSLLSGPSLFIGGGENLGK